MKARCARILLWIGVALLVPGLLIGAFECAAYDVNLHVALHKSLGSAVQAGISEAEMTEMSGALIDYLRNVRDDFPEIRTEEGALLIGETMAHHMVDVRALFDLAAGLRIALLGGGWLLAVLGILLDQRDWKKRLSHAGLLSMAAWMTLLVIAGVYAALDFHMLFTRFHEMFFSNELWLLDPKTDPIIRMLPEPFFLAVAARAALYMALAIIGFSWAVSVPKKISGWRKP